MQKGVGILKTASIMFSLGIQMYEGETKKLSEVHGRGRHGAIPQELAAVTPLIKDPSFRAQPGGCSGQTLYLP